jgi:hypothetical protein
MNSPPEKDPGTDGAGTCGTPPDTIVRYVDQELTGEGLDAFRAHLATCAGCQREVAALSALKGDLHAMALSKIPPPSGSVWTTIDRKLARPTGWVLLVVGAILYAAWAVYTYLQSPMNLFERLGIGLFVVGFFVLLVSVAVERIHDYANDPYKGIER